MEGGGEGEEERRETLGFACKHFLPLSSPPVFALTPFHVHPKYRNWPFSAENSMEMLASQAISFMPKDQMVHDVDFLEL